MADGKMSKKEKQALADYIRAVADILYLRDWDFDVFYGEPETPERAEPGGQEWGLTVEQTRHRKHASITIPEDFRSAPQYQGDSGKQSIAHELIHCHWAMCWDQVRVDLHDALGQIAYDIFIQSYERNMEYGVDALAYAVVDFLPEIQWPPSKK